MNIILILKEDFITPTRVRLSDRRFVHMTTILKSKVGDQLCVGEINGQLGQGHIVTIHDAIEMDVNFDQKPPAPLNVKLILALPRPHLFKRTLFFAAMLGVKEIHVLNFNRVEKSLWGSKSLEPQAIQEQLILGLEQAKDTILPTVSVHPVFKVFINNQLPAIVKDTHAVVAHPQGQPFKPTAETSAVSLVIGPEGGIVDYELDVFKQLGFSQISFGPRIMRVDAALAYIVARLP